MFSIQLICNFCLCRRRVAGRQPLGVRLRYSVARELDPSLDAGDPSSTDAALRRILVCSKLGSPDGLHHARYKRHNTAGRLRSIGIRMQAGIRQRGRLVSLPRLVVAGILARQDGFPLSRSLELQPFCRLREL